MTKKFFFILLLTFHFIPSFYAQNEKDSLVMHFHFKFNKEPLVVNKKYISKTQDTLQISLIKLYVSNIEIQYEDQSVFKQQNSFHLVDIDEVNSLHIPISKKANKIISKVSFDIGIDSLTSTSGALAGDLDPIKGMYWAWQSGYINMKIEGTSASCKTRKNQFQFHIGGYFQPFYAMRKIKINCNFNIKNQIDLVMDLSKLFEEVNLSETNSIMIPGKKAMKLADDSVKMFKIE